jgi:phosphopantetheine adenylyltransferase
MNDNNRSAFWRITFVLVVLLVAATLITKTVSKMEPGDKKKEELKKYMNEKKTELKKVKFTLVGKFGELTQDKKVLQGVMDSAKAGDYAGLERILNSL